MLPPLLATYLLLNVASSLVNIARSKAQTLACKRRGEKGWKGQWSWRTGSSRKRETIEAEVAFVLRGTIDERPFLRIRKRWCTPPTLCNGEWRIGEWKLNVECWNSYIVIFRWTGYWSNYTSIVKYHLSRAKSKTIESNLVVVRGNSKFKIFVFINAWNISNIGNNAFD